MILLWPILVPAIAGLAVLLIPGRAKYLREAVTLIASTWVMGLAFRLFPLNETLKLPWAGYGIEFALRLDSFSAFILLGAAFFGLMIALYSTAFMLGKERGNQFYSYLLLSVALVNGAVLANNLVVMLFFWEGLLLAMFGLIRLGSPEAIKTATKAFIIIGISDLCLMLGIGLTGYLAKTLTMSAISIPLSPLATVAFVCLMIGAIAKAGAMPFHSWIPDAALDAPLPFMAILPASLEKLLGIYFLGRISLQLYQLVPQSWLSYLMMIVGALTILFAVMMALVQKDYKRLLAYHAVSQVGYMILGIGTCVPAGIVGGLFHMINNALYKSCLFLTGGAVEKQAGTTDLAKLGGLGWAMPLTFGAFCVAAASICGVPPFNGFFSKELVYDAALERGWIFYLAAVGGSFFTAASFLKLGHAAFWGKKRVGVAEAPWPMLVPMLLIAAVCIVFGLMNHWPLHRLVQPVLGHARLEGQDFAGLPRNLFLIVMTVVVLAGAYLNHLFGVKKFGSGLKAVDHIHYAPGLKQIYDGAEKRWYDPYDLGLKLADLVARTGYFIDRMIDWFYETLAPGLALLSSRVIRWAHGGNYAVYIVWILVGGSFVLFLAFR
ncbi:MAG: proton-conducting transporter membrane subunit [Candidatus Margulisiibacteriota bacterium]